MRGTLKQLLTVTTLLLTSFSLHVHGQCALITDNYSGQVAGSVCAPVNLSMDVRYKFILPVDPSKVKILYVWNDGTGATTIVPSVSQGDTVFTATASHVYPPADECSYTAEAYVIYDGDQCVSSSRQEQTFSAWSTDNQNGAVIVTDPEVAQYCEGEAIVDQVFADNSTFNCNLNVEPDKPNRITRWVQFIYGTQSTGGARIPNVTIRDPLGNVYQMTDANGNSLPPVPGPIIEIPIPADGPDQISWPISAPAGAVAGDIFEITMRNWNICNPYDKNPFDAVPPSDPVNGDFPPITVPALIEIITTPPVITNPSLEFCAGSPLILTLSTSGGNVNWYGDSLLTNHVYSGNSFDPTGTPTFIDNRVGGTYSFYVTESIGACASAPSRISFDIFDTPAPVPDAGPDAVVCADTFRMNGNTPVIGNGIWSTTGDAVIDDPSDPHTTVRNLASGPNLFRWTMTNGPCISVDEVIITSDLQPAPASAGVNQSFCDLSTALLHASSPNNDGNGTWSVADGIASLSDIHDPQAVAADLGAGMNKLVWTIRSRFNACPETTDTMEILRDITPQPAQAGSDRGICDSSSVYLAATPASGGGKGTWTLVTGSGAFDDVHKHNSLLTGISYGANEYRWTVTSMFGLCASSQDVVAIQRDEAPDPAFAGFDQALCSSVTAPLGANAASAGSASWNVVKSPSPVLPVFIPDISDPNSTVQILSGNEGVYTLAWTIVNGSCRTSDTMSIDFGMPVPPADAGPPDTVCGITAQLAGNDPGIGTGTWRKISGPGSVTFLPDMHQRDVTARISPGDYGSYAFEWRITSGSCPPATDTVVILFKPIPDYPLTGDEKRCDAGTLTLSAIPGSNGDINRWYESATGGEVIATGNSFITPILSADKKYWVATYSHTTGCESYRSVAEAIIHSVPGSPASSDVQHCGSADLTLTSTIGTGATNNRWYDAPVDGNMISSSENYTTPVLTESQTYWISSFNDSTGCESDRISLQVTIDSIPQLPVTADASRCGDGMLTLTSAVGVNGTQNRWYDMPSGGTLLDTTLNYTTPFLTDTAIYWVSSVNITSGCEGSRQEVRAIINRIPGFPGVNDISHCGPDSVLLNAVPGYEATTSRWYDQLTGGTLLAQSNQYQTPYLTSTRRYYVSGYNENTLCESSRMEVKAIILPVPANIEIQGPSLVGQEQGGVIYSVNYQPGSTYNWNIPPGINLLIQNQNFIITEFPYLGTYNLSVTETNSVGCQGPPALKQVEVRDEIIVLNINKLKEDACAGDYLQLNVVPAGGTPSYTFKWTGDSIYLSDTDISNPVFLAQQPGTYQVGITVTDINGNQASDTIEVNVFDNPSVHVIAPDTVVCAGNSLQLNAIANGGSGIFPTYSWNDSAGVLAQTDIPDPVFNTVIPGFYVLRLTVFDNNGCSALDSIILFNDSPTSSFSSNASPDCSPLTVSFINLSKGAASYHWNFGDGSSSNLENPIHVFRNNTSSLDYFNVEMTAISANNCRHTTNEYVTVYPDPDVQIRSYPEVACAPADVLFSATPGGYSYNWDFGDGAAMAGSFNIMHTFENSTDRDTSFHVTLEAVSFFNCLDTAHAFITVHPSPVASFTADPVSQMMPDRTVTVINATPEGKWTYEWNFGDGSFSGDRNPGSHMYEGPDQYLITLKVNGEHCSDSTWTSVEIVPHPPVAEFTPVEPGCMPLTIQFENKSLYSNSFLWEFGDGAVSNKPNPEYTYYEPGIYKIKLTAWGEGGTDTYSTVNSVWVLPNAYFEVAPRIVYVNDQPVRFFNLSDNGDIYEWDFGDGTGSTEMNPSHQYEKDGTYTVTLRVWTKNDCFDLYEMKAAVIVEPTGMIVFPNAFRPESYIEENRTFHPGVIDHVEEYHLMIFNRWGELIFESFDKDLGWDGTVGGVMSKQDVYVWKVEGKFSGGRAFADAGDVTLLH